MDNIIVTKNMDLTQFMAVCTQVQSIEAQAYPEYMHGLQDIVSPECVLDYAEAKKVTVFYTHNCYLIVTKREVVDLACVGKLGVAELLSIKECLKKHFGIKKFSLDARESTSYRLVQFINRRSDLLILTDTPWSWGNETFHDLTVMFTQEC
jgi:hypothetical protein